MIPPVDLSINLSALAWALVKTVVIVLYKLLYLTQGKLDLVVK